jgi:hypothetical protein
LALRASGYIAQPLWSILSNIPMPPPLYYHNEFSFKSTKVAQKVKN